MSKESIGNTFSSYIFEFILVFLSFVIASVLSTISVHLPANTTHQISNLNLINGFNPEESYLRIVLLVVFGLATYLVLKKLSSNDKRFRTCVIAILAFALLTSVITPTIKSFSNNIDTFHHGEQLAPAHDFGKGKGLYNGLFVLHGAGDDVLLPYLALKLPGTNPAGGIGSYYFVVASLQLVSAVLFFMLLSRLFKSTVVFLTTSVWFSLSYYSIFYYVRDIFVWTILLVATYLLLGKAGVKAKRNLLVFIGFLASSTFFFAVDRGFIATLSVILTACSLVLFIPSAKGWRFNHKITLQRLWPGLYALIGGATAQFLGLVLLGPSQYIEFLKTSFVVIPKYQGYLFDSPLAKFSPIAYVTWLPIIIAMIGLILLFHVWQFQLRKNKLVTPAVLLSSIMYATSILFLRIGYGRPDYGHIAYSTPLLFVSVFYLCTVAYQEFRDTDTHMLWPVALILILMLVPVQTISLERVAAFTNAEANQAIDYYIKLPRNEDRKWLPQSVSTIADYIKQNTKPSDPIFVFTQQPIYYYLSDRQNSSKFYIPWFADPEQLTNELLKELQTNPPKLIVYSSGTGWDKPDGYGMETRAPGVNAWILTNYTKATNVSGATILQR